MKTIMKTATTFYLLLTAQFGLAQSSKDSLDVQKLAESTVTYFYKGDITSFGNLFSSDAIFIAVTGVVAKGQSQIVDMHKKWKIDSATTIKYKPPYYKIYYERHRRLLHGLGRTCLRRGTRQRNSSIRVPDSSLTEARKRLENSLSNKRPEFYWKEEFRFDTL